MKVKVNVKEIKKIDSDEDYYEAWKLVNELDGKASILIDVSNGDIKDPLKEAKKYDRKRNKLLDMMRNYIDKPHEDKDFE